MCDQNTTRAAAYTDIPGSEREPVAGKQASRRTLLKVGGRLIAGVAAYVSPPAAAPCAVAADDGPRDIVKRDPQASSLVSSIAEFVHGTRFGDLSDTVRRIARQHLLDTVGCCLAAVRLETSRSLASYLVSEGGVGQATGISIEQQLPVPQAAFMNGLLARSLEFDDMALPDLHPSGAIVPVVLALGEWQGASGGQVIVAYAIGLELCLRLDRAGYDRASRSSRFLERGQDATAICGTLAGAAAAAKLLGLDAKGIANAIGIAVSFAAGSLEANRSGGSIKRFQSGWAAKSAIEAALLAKYGVDGPAQALEGRYGFYHCFVDGQFDPLTLTDGLASDWQASVLRFKPYPCNYYTHAGIDAALALRQKGLKADEVASAQLAVATPMLHTIGEPLDRKQAPQTAYEAKFSGPYTVTSALIGGSGLGLGLDDFTDALIHDPTRRELMRRISVTSDPRCDAIFPQQAPAILSVRTKDGRRMVEEVLINRGSPERPLSDNELAVKFSENCRRVLVSETTEALRSSIDRIEETADVAQIVRILAAVAD
jgi:2-methylcitrate dehydratase PrpD